MKVRRSRAADADLDAIFDYTAEHWGVAQVVGYVAAFDEAFARLAGNPTSGVSAASPSGYRRLRQASHFIFYLVEGDTIRVERILHERLDAPANLP